MGDWRQFRAKLVQDSMKRRSDLAGFEAGRLTQANLRLMREQSPSLAGEDIWAHPTGAPELGGIVVATARAADVLGSQYAQAVVFLAQHDASSSVGFILNRPTSLTLGRVPVSPTAGRSKVSQTFTDNRLYCGGFEGQQVVSLMHGYKGLEDSAEVVPGIYLGGDVLQAAAAGRFKSLQEVKFFAGCVAWGPGELQSQIDASAWSPAACSRALVLKNCVALPVPLWVETLRLMGGRHAAAAAEEYPSLPEDG